jgi:hypothetical protein
MIVSRMLTALRKQNVAKASFHPDGSLQSVEFVQATQSPKTSAASVLAASAERHSEVKYVPGTDIPDDKTPLNPLDTILKSPSYNAWENQ